MGGVRMMTPAECVAWAEQQESDGKRDAMGYSFTSWSVARYLPDGRAMRDEYEHQVFESQAEFKARYAAITLAVPVGQTMDLFS